MLATTLFFLVTLLAAAVQAERSVDVFAWPLSSNQAQSLASISYTAANATVSKYTPPKISIEDDVVRIGFYSSGLWSGIATAASSFDPGKDKKVQLYINADEELVHIGFKASSFASSSKTGKSKEELGVELIHSRKGPIPHVNKPVVLNAEGQVEQKEPEKTFLQKYWWVLAGFLVMQIVAMGGKEGGKE